jgi:hypothetical protein
VSRCSIDDTVDVVVLKHRWRWKLVDENEDEEAMNASFLPENASRICRLVEKNIQNLQMEEEANALAEADAPICRCRRSRARLETGCPRGRTRGRRIGSDPVELETKRKMTSDHEEGKTLQTQKRTKNRKDRLAASHDLF